MTINPQALLDHDFPEVRQTLSRRDAGLYALSIGLGDRPHDPRRLRYIYEEGVGEIAFAAAPTQPVTMGFYRWVLTPELGIDFTGVVHGEESITINGPVPVEGTVRAKLSVVGVADKGRDRGALISTRRDIFTEDSDQPFAIIETTTFCRRDGGCGSVGTVAPLGAPTPDTAPDEIWSVDIPVDAALLYRLSGDLNPLHIDPAYAAAAGFEKPILHGLCTFALAARPVWQDLPEHKRLQMVACRFAGPVFPGDKLEIELWRQDKAVRFRGHVGGRPVLEKGIAKVTDSGTCT